MRLPLGFGVAGGNQADWRYCPICPPRKKGFWEVIMNTRIVAVLAILVLLVVACSAEAGNQTGDEAVSRSPSQITTPIAISGLPWPDEATCRDEFHERYPGVSRNICEKIFLFAENDAVDQTVYQEWMHRKIVANTNLLDCILRGLKAESSLRAANEFYLGNCRRQ